MGLIAGIHLLTEKKARVLTAITSSLRDSAPILTTDEAEKARDLLNDKRYSEQFNHFSDSLTHEIAVLLTDDYLSVLYEDIEPETLEETAAAYSERFSLPCLFVGSIDEENLLFGIAYDGKVQTRRILGDMWEDYGLSEEEINMDHLARTFRDPRLSDLNDITDAEDMSYALEEDYGIDTSLSPAVLPIFDDRYRCMEQNDIFAVYAVKN